MNGLPGLNVMRSKNTFGLSTVVLVFDDGIFLDMLVGNIMCVRHNSAGEFSSIREEDIPVIESHLIPLMPDKMIDYEEAE